MKLAFPEVRALEVQNRSWYLEAQGDVVNRLIVTEITGIITWLLGALDILSAPDAPRRIRVLTGIVEESSRE